MSRKPRNHPPLQRGGGGGESRPPSGMPGKETPLYPPFARGDDKTNPSMTTGCDSFNGIGSRSSLRHPVPVAPCNRGCTRPTLAPRVAPCNRGPAVGSPRGFYRTNPIPPEASMESRLRGDHAGGPFARASPRRRVSGRLRTSPTTLTERTQFRPVRGTR